jgi:hypothetical protein
VLVLAQVATAQVCFEPLTTVNQGIYAYEPLGTDLDGDGDADLVTIGPPQLSVFLNHGNGMFAPHAAYGGGAGGFGVIGDDFDADGDQDLAVLTGVGVKVFPNLGNGTFGTHVQYGAGPSASGIASADFDGDGDIDVATSNVFSGTASAPQSPGCVSVLLNQGQGSFAPAVQYPAGHYPYSVTSADLDGDGDVDLAVANDLNILPPSNLAGTVSVLLNQGNGTFAAPVFHVVGDWTSSAYDLTNADLNGDGRVDLVAANDNNDYIAVLLNQGGGAFAPYKKYPVAGGPYQVVATDLDEDGDVDLAAACAEPGAPRSASLLLNRGDGTFAPHQELDSSTVYRLTHADFDGDGDSELAVQNIYGIYIAVTVTVYRNCVEQGIGFCFGDGSLLTKCPCVWPYTSPAPAAATARGCANSLNFDGARLVGGGALAPAPGKFAFRAQIAPGYLDFAFLVKGDTNATSGIAAGDGIRCVDGALVRFGAHHAGTNGALIGIWSYPNSVQTIPVSIATAQVAGEIAYYQLIYRDEAANFCNAATVNWSNGYRITWPP